MSTPHDGGSERDAFAAFRRDFDKHKRLVEDLALTVNGREPLGIPGLRQRLVKVEASVDRMNDRQEQLQRIHDERQRKQKRRDVYVIASVAGLFAIVSTVVGVLLQSGLG